MEMEIVVFSKAYAFNPILLIVTSLKEGLKGINEVESNVVPLGSFYFLSTSN